MKGKIIFMLLIMLCFCMGGCRPVNEEQKFKVRNTSEKLQGNQIMEEIVAALDTGDVERLKAMFSEAVLVEYDEWAALEEIENGESVALDEQIAGVMEYYQGMMVSYEGTVDSSRSRDYNIVVLELMGHYTLETDKEEYKILFKYKPIDDKDSKEVGLIMLEIVKKEVYDRIHDYGDFNWQHYNEGIGIYWQDYDEENSKWYFYGEGPDIESEEDL